MSGTDFQPYGISADKYDEIVEHLVHETKSTRLLARDLVNEGLSFSEAQNVLKQIQADLDESPRAQSQSSARSKTEKKVHLYSYPQYTKF